MTDPAAGRVEERRALVAALRSRRDLGAGVPPFSEAVLGALERVPRHAFVPAEQEPFAYADRPLPIGSGQTISQPTVVAMMTELATTGPEAVVLEIGTGCGYQTAVLAELVHHVYSVELLPTLAEAARTRLAQLGYENVSIRVGDGWEGWPEHAPFDAIVVTAAAPRVPPPLLAQLGAGGRLVIPVDSEPGFWGQELRVIEKDVGGARREWSAGAVAFVPLRRRNPAGAVAGWREPKQEEA